MYRATKALVSSHTAQLKQLGVPFFGVRPDLVLAEGVVDAAASEGPRNGTGEAVLVRVSRARLAKLQRDMLRHLVDMYGD